MRNYVRKSDRIVCSPEMLQQAQQRLANGESKVRIAKSIGISEAALRKRLKKGSGVKQLGRFRSTFTQDQENDLASHCKTLDECFYGLSFMDLRRSVFQYAEANKIVHGFNPNLRVAGKEWALSFMRRHKLSLRTPQPTSLARMMGFNRVQVDIFFKNLREITTKHRFSEDRIYNMDETGISTVPNNTPKVVSATGKKSVGKVTSGERGELVTAVCAMSAQGNYVAPVLIFKRKRQKPELMNGAPLGSQMFISDTGYINSDLFYQWVQHFQRQTNATKENPVLFILDNHSSHQSLRAVLYCHENGIELVSIPPHSSHKVQPLDRCFFQSLKTNYAEACNNWLVTHPGRVITQYQVAELFGIAYARSATIEKAINAFRMCGIVPINPGIFTDQDFAPSEVTNNEKNSENFNSKDVQRLNAEVSEFLPLAQNHKSDITMDIAGTSTSEKSTPLSMHNVQRRKGLPKGVAQTKPHSTEGDVLGSSTATDPHECGERFRPFFASLRNILDTFEATCTADSTAIIIPTTNQSQRSENVPFSSINPLPKRSEPQKRRKRGQKSEIMTSRQFIKKLEQKADEQVKTSSMSSNKRKNAFQDIQPTKKRVKIRNQ